MLIFLGQDLHLNKAFLQVLITKDAFYFLKIMTYEQVFVSPHENWFTIDDSID